MDVSNAALYPFGFGLSYAPVAYDKPVVDGAQLAWDGAITLSCEIRNTGDSAIDEVVQLYLQDVTASVTRPVRELKGFRKLRLAPGESKRVAFRVARSDLEFVGADLKWRAEPGLFRAWIAPSSAAGEPVSFMLKASSA